MIAETDFNVWNSHFKKWVPETFKARIFEMPDGTTVRLFKTGVLAAALGRTPATIARWEKQGLLPEPIYVINDPTKNTTSRRLYSEAQIRMVQRHAREILGNDPNTTVNQRVDHETFFSLVRKEWTKELDKYHG